MNVLELRKNSENFKNQLKNEYTQDKTTKYTDDRFWSLDYNKDTKIGKAIIRPIGPASGEKDMFVAEHTHFIRRNGKFLSLNCPTTIGQKCPICEYYFSKEKEERDPQFSRNTKYIMNILVVEDFQHPENNGKVFLYRCPATIMNKIKEALEETDEMGQPKESINVFDMWEGANINVITKDKNGWLNYESSRVTSKSPIFEDVDNPQLYQELYDKLYSLSEFKDAPSTEEVREKFNAFMSNVDTSSNNVTNHIKEKQTEVFDTSDNISDDLSLTDETTEDIITTEDDFFNDL